MSSRGTYRWHSSLFKIQVCQEIRTGGLLRRGAQEKYNLSASLIQHWLTLYDRGELVSEAAEAVVVVEYQVKIPALERKVGQLTMELDLLNKTPSPRHVSNNESACVGASAKLSHCSGRCAEPDDLARLSTATWSVGC